MNKIKRLLISFDYELFLGEQSGTPKECLIRPTHQLLACLNKFMVKAIFFIDTVYLMRLEEMAGQYPNVKVDLELINTQLTQIVKNGHEIHPHIHPHWLDAVYDEISNEWNLTEKKHYTFASINEIRRRELFYKSIIIIRSVLEKAGSGQTIDCYRAGGWSIQPFENFRPYFMELGIKHEWSVIPGKYQFSDANCFDFREAPIENPVFRFDKDPCIEDKSGSFTEWTISSLKLNRNEKWFDFKVSGLLGRLGRRPSLKGKTVSSVIKEEGDKYCGKDDRRIIASFEGLNPFNLRKYIDVIGKAEYFQFISHPKLISPYEFNMMDKLFRALKKRNELETDFRKAVFE